MIVQHNPLDLFSDIPEPGSTWTERLYPHRSVRVIKVHQRRFLWITFYRPWVQTGHWNRKGNWVTEPRKIEVKASEFWENYQPEGTA